MSVALVNDQYVILPHLPDWSSRVEWTRRWESGVVDGMDGSEARVAVRTKGRHGIRFTANPYNLQERAKLICRLRAAAKSGYVAVPFWGRGLRLASAQEGSTSVTLTAPTAWLFDVGDPVFFCCPEADLFDAWEVRTLASLMGTTMTLDAALARTYPAGWFCWPMLLGNAKHGDIDLRSDWHASVQIDVLQLATREDPILDLCAIVLSVDGSGDCFDCYPAEDPLITTLGAGNGWAAAWNIQENDLGLRIWDTFQTYYVGENPGGLNGGHGWNERWYVYANPRGIQILETFDPYADQNPVDGFLSAGLGFIDPWVLLANPTGIKCTETFDSYQAENPLSQLLDEGTGWYDGWNVQAVP